jgi:hypothetical protein
LKRFRKLSHLLLARYRVDIFGQKRTISQGGTFGQGWWRLGAIWWWEGLKPGVPKPSRYGSRHFAQFCKGTLVAFGKGLIGQDAQWRHVRQYSRIPSGL